MPSLRDVTPERVWGAITSRANYWFVHPVVGTVPRLVWGNDAGLRGNVRGELDRRRGRAAYRAATGTALRATPEGERLRADGVLVVDPEYPAGLVERLRSSYLAALADDSRSAFNGVGRFRETSRAVLHAAKELDGVDDVLTPRLRAVIEAYYGGWFEVHQVEAWHTKAVDGLVEDTKVEAYSNQWHNDRYPTSWLRVFVYLSDGVTRETGAFRCHPIPSTRAIVRSGGYLRRSLMTNRARRALEDERRVVYFEGDAGATCLANAMHCLHRAGVPKPGTTRDMLALTFRPASRPLPSRWSAAVGP